MVTMREHPLVNVGMGVGLRVVYCMTPVSVTSLLTEEKHSKLTPHYLSFEEWI